MKNGVFWVVTPCGSCKNRRFGGTWRLLHQGDRQDNLNLETLNRKHDYKLLKCWILQTKFNKLQPQQWRMQSSGMWRCVALVSMDVLVERTTSIIRVERIRTLEMLPVNSNWSTLRRTSNYMGRSNRLGYKRDGWRKGQVGLCADIAAASSSITMWRGIGGTLNHRTTNGCGISLRQGDFNNLGRRVINSVGIA
jgi:hypothetical protein